MVASLLLCPNSGSGIGFACRGCKPVGFGCVGAVPARAQVPSWRWKRTAAQARHRRARNSPILPFRSESVVRVFLKGLRQPRMACKITQTRVAELLAVSPRVYTRRENGDALPPFATGVKIADILNVSLDEWAGRQEANVGEARIHNPELPGCARKSINFPTQIRRLL